MVSLALDELTDLTSTTPLLFIQGDNAKFEVTEELTSINEQSLWNRTGKNTSNETEKTIIQ